MKGQRAVPLFDDIMDWWFAGDEHGSGVHAGHYQPGCFSVDVPRTETTIGFVPVVTTTPFTWADSVRKLLE